MGTVFFCTFAQNNIIMGKIYISSERLQLVESIMQKYFDYDSVMLDDEIRNCVEQSGINYIYPPEKEGGLHIANYEKTFEEHKELVFFVNTPYKKNFTNNLVNTFIYKVMTKKKSLPKTIWYGLP